MNIRYIASILQEGTLKHGLIDRNGNWIIAPKYERLVELDRKGFYEFTENDKRGIINEEGEIIVKPNFEFLDFLDENILVKINNKYGIINSKEEFLIDSVYDTIDSYNIENIVRIEIDKKFGLINLNSDVLVQPKYESISHIDNKGFIRAKLNGRTGCINLDGEILIDFKFDNLNEFDDRGYAIAGENNNKGFIDINGNWIIRPIYSSVEEFNNEYAIVRIHLFFGVINRSGKWILPAKYSECKINDKDTFVVSLENKKGVVDIYGEWVESSIDKLYFFDKNNLRAHEENQKYGIINTESKWIVKPEYEYVFQMVNSENYLYRLNSKQGIIVIKNNYIIPPIYDKVVDLCDFNQTAIVKLEGKFGLINYQGETLINPSLSHIKPFSQKGYAVAKNFINKWGIINTNGDWVVSPYYDELEDIDEFGLFKATIKTKYGWIDINGDFAIQPDFDKIIKPIYEVQEIDEFYYLVDEVFKEDLLDVYFFDEIPYSKKQSFNKSLDTNFVDNIEYLMLYDDTIDGTNNDGIAIVKKNKEFFLILKEHRWNPVIFRLNLYIGNNPINSLCYDEDNHCITVMADKKANINNKLTYYSPEPFEGKMCMFRFYNTDFLKLFDEFYIRLRAEIGWQISV